MLEREYIKQHLERAVCYKCGASLEGAKLLTIMDSPVSFLAHAVCPKCQGQTMVSITPTGSGTVPLVSDMSGPEIKKFMFEKNVSYEELFDLHKKLKKTSVWNLLQKKDKNSVKKSKA